MKQDCSIVFNVTVRTTLQQVVGVVGNQPQLGNWNHRKACILKTDAESFPQWTLENPLLFSKATKLEFKFVILENDNAIWEELPQNRKYRCRYWKVILTAEWNNYEGKEVIEQRFKSSMCLNQETLQHYTKAFLIQNSIIQLCLFHLFFYFLQILIYKKDINKKQILYIFLIFKIDCLLVLSIKKRIFYINMIILINSCG